VLATAAILVQLAAAGFHAVPADEGIADTGLRLAAGDVDSGARRAAEVDVLVFGTLDGAGLQLGAAQQKRPSLLKIGAARQPMPAS
jgi:hypothetical protein